MSHEELSVESINKNIKKYIGIFVALMVLSGLTVFTHYLETSVAMGIAIAMVIATIKGTMVAGYFMHLFHEARLIYWTLLFTALFFMVILALPVLTYLDRFW